MCHQTVRLDLLKTKAWNTGAGKLRTYQTRIYLIYLVLDKDPIGTKILAIVINAKVRKAFD